MTGPSPGVPHDAVFRRRVLFRAAGAVFLCLAFCVSAASAAPPKAPAVKARPKIGLVLSGGGARGLAHIGVLKILEEQRIPIDCIAGTSMGAVVGGLYASGLSADDLETLVSGLPWNEAFTDKPPPQELAFRRKEDSQRYKININLGYKDGKFAFPKGLLQGQNLNVLLKKQLLHAATVDDFDQLPIPFRAVAADIETGEEVVLGSGDLATALRASMSIPGVFAPVEIGGKMLVDGGIANNLPVNVARDMGADILIVVDIATPLRNRRDLTSAAAISSQVMTIMVQRNVQWQIRALHPSDVLIQPNLGELGTTDFSEVKQAVDVGVVSARKALPRLTTLSAPPEAYAAFLDRQRLKPQDPPTLAFVTVDNNSKLSPKVLEAQVETKAGEKLDPEKLTRDIRRLYGMDTFERVDFRLEKRKKQTGLVIEPVEKSWGPTYVKFALGLADDFKGSNTYSIGASITQTEMNALGGEWRTELQMGESPRIFTEFYQPLDTSTRWFIAPQVEYRERNVNSFNGNGDTVSQYRVRYVQAALTGGRQFGNWGEFRAGLMRTYGATRLNIGDPASNDSTSFNRGGLLSMFAVNTLDDYSFPTRGTSLDATAEVNLFELGSDNKSNAMSVSGNYARTWGRYTVIPGILYAGYFNTDAAVQDTFNLGGFFNLSGYLPNQLSGQHVGVGRVIFYRNMGRLGLGGMTSQFYLGGSIEAGNAWAKREDITFNSLIWAGSVFLGANTFLGPVYLSYGMAEAGHQAVGLNIGQRF